ncbi:MAG TPA: hypothetical protein VI873_00395 [Candidatus Peribacteraceae bacterium]|nr:hypothetical protein [Candidatus Peribacteraceae bacterium]
MNKSKTLDQLISEKNSGIDIWEAKFIRANVPNAFLHSPITDQSREWLWINAVVLEKWIWDRGNGPELADERLKCQAFSDAERFANDHLHAELLALLNTRVKESAAAVLISEK